MAPNVTGWANAIEEFLRVRGYVFRGPVCATSSVDLRLRAATDSLAECIPKAIRQCVTVVSSSGTEHEARGRLLGTGSSRQPSRST